MRQLWLKSAVLSGMCEQKSRHAELRRKVRARASKATGGMSLCDNRQSLKGLNSNSLYGEAYHQMFILNIKEK